MTNREAIEELRDIYKEIDDVFIYTGDKKIEALDLAIKALEERSIVEKIVNKGGMTLVLRKPDREISDLANVIADMLGDITIGELKDKFNTITFIDNNTGCIVKYFRVDVKEEEK